jgi:hypothetical protein
MNMSPTRRGKQYEETVLRAIRELLTWATKYSKELPELSQAVQKLLIYPSDPQTQKQTEGG